MATPSNGSADTRFHADDEQNTSWYPLRHGRRNVLEQVVGNGGLGQPPQNSLPPRNQSIIDALDTYDKQYLPGQPKSLSGIATRSLLLGSVLTLSTILSLYTLLTTSSPLWRAPFFLASLSLFHFLEFWTTARCNTRSAQISSFLLSQNGSAYNIAHTTALLECVLTNYFFPTRHWLPPTLNKALMSLGLIFILVGQTTRTLAMIEAGTNFNHIVQHTKRREHSLVTSGVYAILRHPSYFGFFWWGLGTQMVLGNPICFAGYTAVLWRFFSRRIAGEEQLLVAFFGDEYVKYREMSWVGVPFIK